MLTVIARSFPPLVIGSPILLKNLLSDYSGDLNAIAGWQYGAKVDPDFTPPCKTSYIRMPNEILQRAYDRYVRQLVPFNRWLIKRKLNSNRPKICLITCPGGEFFVAAALACKNLQIPYMVHMHDLWSDNLTKGSKLRSFADRFEGPLLEGAKEVFAMTEVQKTFLDDKYGINCKLLPHTIPESKLEDLPSFDRSKASRKEKTIIYTGNVSHAMNLDAIRQFIQTVSLLPKQVKVKMFISWSKERREKEGIQLDRIEYGWLPMEEVLEEVKRANAVFLPLSFKNAAMAEVETVFATKTLDYLVSGTPIIAFSPSNSYHTISAKANGWALTVNQDDPKILMDQIMKLISDATLSAHLVARAHLEAKSRAAKSYASELLRIVEQS